MLQFRQLTFRPSPTPGIRSLLTVRSTGRYRFRNHLEENVPRGFSQLFWVAEGALRFFRSGAWHPAEAGDTFFYPAREAHRLRIDEPVCEYFWITFDGPLAGAWLNQEFPDPAARKAGNCPVDLFEQIRKTISLPTISAEREAAELGLRLVMKFVDSAGPHQATERSHEETFCRKLEALIHLNYADPGFGIAEAARQLGRHRTTVFRMYRDQRGITPSAYLQRTRLQQGLELLRRSDMNISEIANASGFRDPNYFTKVIREATGEAPRQVRRQH
jgi:AraC-like DNA-binding protein